MSKKNRLSLINLLKESVDEDYPTTLTDNEVFIMNYLADEVDPSLLSQAERAYDDFIPQKMSKLVDIIFGEILLYIGMKNKRHDKRLLQYVICYNENDGKEITTSTPIKRLANYNFKVWDVTNQIVYNKYTTNDIPSFSEDDVKDKQEQILGNLWYWDTTTDDSDYGDSDFIRYEDPEFEQDSVGYLVL